MNISICGKKKPKQNKYDTQTLSEHPAAIERLKIISRRLQEETMGLFSLNKNA